MFVILILLADNLAPVIKNEQCFAARFFILQAICTSNCTSTLKVLTIAAESSLERRFRHTKDFPFLIACIKYRIGDLNILNITLTLTSTKWKKRSSLGQHVTHIYLHKENLAVERHAHFAYFHLMHIWMKPHKHFFYFCFAVM